MSYSVWYKREGSDDDCLFIADLPDHDTAERVVNNLVTDFSEDRCTPGVRLAWLEQD